MGRYWLKYFDNGVCFTPAHNGERMTWDTEVAAEEACRDLIRGGKAATAEIYPTEDSEGNGLPIGKYVCHVGPDCLPYGNLLQPILNPQHYGFGPGWVPWNPAGNPYFFGFMRNLHGNFIDFQRYSVPLSPEVQAAWSQYAFTGPYR